MQLLSGEARRVQADTSDSLGDLSGKSAQMKTVFDLIRKVANSSLTTLITGETGTGKELVARAIHAGGPRASAAFVVVDCGTIPEHLMESELFGHERGAFTGATSLHKGAFEQADGGTVLLDEIGELHLQLQPKLLRVLERLEIKRVGGSKPIGVDVRMIAATNRNLKQEVKAGRFREDLFYRLSVVEIPLPPLREHLEDIPLLVEQFLQHSSVDAGGKRFSDGAINILMSYGWPGNVRQLRNVVERVLLLAEGDIVEPKNLVTLMPTSGKIDAPTGKSLAEIEKSAIQYALKSCGGNKAATAKSLGIAYSTLYEKMKKYGILTGGKTD